MAGTVAWPSSATIVSPRDRPRAEMAARVLCRLRCCCCIHVSHRPCTVCLDRRRRNRDGYVRGAQPGQRGRLCSSKPSTHTAHTTRTHTPHTNTHALTWTLLGREWSSGRKQHARQDGRAVHDQGAGGDGGEAASSAKGHGRGGTSITPIFSLPFSDYNF